MSEPEQQPTTSKPKRVRKPKKKAEASHEYLVQTTAGPMRIAAANKEEAKAIATKDGHTITKDDIGSFELLVMNPADASIIEHTAIDKMVLDKLVTLKEWVDKPVEEIKAAGDAIKATHTDGVCNTQVDVTKAVITEEQPKQKKEKKPKAEIDAFGTKINSAHGRINQILMMATVPMSMKEITAAIGIEMRLKDADGKVTGKKHTYYNHMRWLEDRGVLERPTKGRFLLKERFRINTEAINPDAEAVWNEPSDVQEGAHLPPNKDFDKIAGIGEEFTSNEKEWLKEEIREMTEDEAACYGDSQTK